MKSNDPTSPLYWVENEVENVLRIADNSLASLKGNDADVMHDCRRVAESMLNRLQVVLSRLLQHNRTDAIELAICISQLTQKALTIGAMVPSASISTRTAINEGRAAHAREARAKGERSTAIDAAIEGALPAGWDGKNPWIRAGLLMKKPRLEELSKRAIYDRLKARKKKLKL